VDCWVVDRMKYVITLVIQAKIDVINIYVQIVKEGVKIGVGVDIYPFIVANINSFNLKLISIINYNN